MKENLLILLLITTMVMPTTFAGTSGPSPIPPAPTFQISTPTLILCRGMTNNIPITISNLGNTYKPTMSDVQLSLNAKGLSYIGNAINVSSITSYNSTVVNVPVFVNFNITAPLITVQFPIAYNYLTFYSDSEIRNLTFGVRTCPMPMSVNVSPTIITSGQKNNITFSFTNNGNTLLNNITVQVSFTNSQGAYFLGSQPIVINSIHPQNTVTVNGKVYANSSQVYPFNLAVNFFNGTSPMQISDTFYLTSSGLINMVPSSITISPTNVTAGSIFSISFVITDIGTVGASAVTATTLVPKGFKPYGSNSTFIGDMQTDTQTSVTLTFMSNASVKDGSYSIPIRINYLNNLRENLSTIINVPVTIGKRNLSGTYGSNSLPTGFPSGRSSYDLYLELGLVGAVIGLTILFVRERKNAHHKPK